MQQNIMIEIYEYALISDQMSWTVHKDISAYTINFIGIKLNFISSITRAKLYNSFSSGKNMQNFADILKCIFLKNYQSLFLEVKLSICHHWYPCQQTISIFLNELINFDSISVE